MKNIIIFGGAGFIGTNLCIKLLNDNCKILCIDNLSTGFNRITESSLCKFIKADITDIYIFDIVDKEIREFFNGKVDEIYNLACPASPPKYLSNPLGTIHASLAVESLCKIAMKYDAKLLHASTSEVYGNPDRNPLEEEYNGNVNMIGPRSCYDEGKRIAETIMYEYYKLGCKGKIIRIFNTYGPYMSPDDGRVISNFICQALTGDNITIQGNGTQTRSFLYIDDLIEGMLKMMNSDIFGPVNIGNPEEITIYELAKIIKEKTNSNSNIIYIELPKDDPIQRKADISKAYKFFNYKPCISLDEGLDKTIEYFKKLIR